LGQVPQWGAGAMPRWRASGDEVSEAEEKCEISLQLLTFSCRKFRI